jgi:hypothetical protein
MQRATAAVIACDLLPTGEPPPPGEPARQAPSTGRATARLPAFHRVDMAATLCLQVIAAVDGVGMSMHADHQPHERVHRESVRVHRTRDEG